MNLPKGNWIESAKEINADGNNNIRCQLRKIDGNWNSWNVKFRPDAHYENLDGYFYGVPPGEVSTIIPKNIFQTHKSIQFVNSKSETRRSLKSWQRYSDFKYHFFDDSMCWEFICAHFDTRVQQAYQKLPMAVMKADLWRYCVIYIYGGIYADTDAVCAGEPHIFLQHNAHLVLGPENSCHLCQWTFAAPAGSPVLKTIIDLSVDKILQCVEIKGEHIIHILTGPGVFTEGVERYLQNEGLVTYEDKKRYANYKNNRIHVFSHDEFHQNMIHHLFTGQHQDGWYHERFQKLM